jgi:two-component system, OmpR family, sensor histidine kinase BaeS
MTVKRQWLLTLVLTAVIAVIVNSAILGTLINRYFVSYTEGSYDMHIDRITELAVGILTEDHFTQNQIALQLKAHLVEPITAIELYDAKGNALTGVESTYEHPEGMMDGRMMDLMMGALREEIETIDVYDGDDLIGVLFITKYSSAGNTISSRLFGSVLIINILLSFGIVIIFVVFIGIHISGKMSRDLVETASQAESIDLGDNDRIIYSRVKEIRVIQQSLESQRTKLRLKQKARKKLTDELMHQTGTPLTILRNHIEAFRDGVIEMKPEQLDTCEDQIQILTKMIADIGRAIDTQKETAEVRLEKFDFSRLIKQIMDGSRIQFNKKDLELLLKNNEKAIVCTDKYLLAQSIYNLLTNAYKFTPPGGKVEVSYEIDDTMLLISVKDSGIGISTEERPKLFEAYFRAANVYDIPGEGLGLYIAMDNVKRLGGDISVESEKGHGSRFTIRLPVSGCKEENVLS